VKSVLDKELEGFGELFRMLSFQEIGPAAMLSRAVAGVRHGKFVAALPGSPDACRLAMEKLLIPELGHITYLLSK
jgi:molybdenum cofactor biosynthesis protein B